MVDCRLLYHKILVGQTDKMFLYLRLIMSILFSKLFNLTDSLAISLTSFCSSIPVI